MRWSSELEMRTSGGLSPKLKLAAPWTSAATNQQIQPISSALTHHQLRPSANRHHGSSSSRANWRTPARWQCFVPACFGDADRLDSTASICSWHSQLDVSSLQEQVRKDKMAIVDGLGNWISFCFPFLFLMLMGGCERKA